MLYYNTLKLEMLKTQEFLAQNMHVHARATSRLSSHARRACLSLTSCFPASLVSGKLTPSVYHFFFFPLYVYFTPGGEGNKTESHFASQPVLSTHPCTLCPGHHFHGRRCSSG